MPRAKIPKSSKTRQMRKVQGNHNTTFILFGGWIRAQNGPLCSAVRKTTTSAYISTFLFLPGLCILAPILKTRALSCILATLFKLVSKYARDIRVANSYHFCLRLGTVAKFSFIHFSIVFFLFSQLSLFLVPVLLNSVEMVEIRAVVPLIAKTFYLGFSRHFLHGALYVYK